ncbi:hypothetical protein SUGI_0130470 [Cryptomeria japonica]|uniref:protein LURP-one-related 12 n=1 Tax=Cryptomeria japonica TaxID=3369 RepID=UPI002408932B|nr:protein LURP-one-related 12 [Cryptomeria japonica]GLJ10554.1 hypothetical protein SUGI_0130470 [Cryptomeria japonica]
MAQVHPQASCFPPRALVNEKFCLNSRTIFTVWRKSLVFNGNGFTVYDSFGNLVFRVDNYASNADKEMALMDHIGNVLITMRRKTMSIQNRWEAFRGNPKECKEPIFTVTKSSPFSNKTTAKVTVNNNGQSYRGCNFQIDGSLQKASCTISNANGDIVAQVKRKEARSDIMLGEDVISLVIQPRVDQAFIMGLLVIFNQMT